jgi:hypothetical protein
MNWLNTFWQQSDPEPELAGGYSLKLLLGTKKHSGN